MKVLNVRYEVYGGVLACFASSEPPRDMTVSPRSECSLRLFAPHGNYTVYEIRADSSKWAVASVLFSSKALINSLYFVNGEISPIASSRRQSASRITRVEDGAKT